MFKNISVFIWFLISYVCKKNEICLEFLGRYFRILMKCQNVEKIERKYLCIFDREELFLLDLQ